MEPMDVVYDVCRFYIQDQSALVDPALVAKIDGFRRSRNLAGLASCSCHFDWHSHSINEWRFLRQIEAFFKKNSVFTNKEESLQAAISSFKEAEKQCAIANFRLDICYVQRRLISADLNSQMSRMERYISNVLGNFRSFMDEIPHLVKVTPGATAHAPRRNSLPQLKLKMKLYSTSGASPFVRTLYRYYGFSTPRIKEVSSNRVEFVPKNWKTDRTIACEPEGNLPFQLAFDAYAKRRLRRFGIDLRDQSANQRKAMQASKDNRHVTVDFKAASDTICFNCVAWVFPMDWFQYLCALRSPKYRGSSIGEGSYHKFSSMGNGSTFTIETLIFAAACYAVGARDFLVYGDDVIIEKEYYDKFLLLTRFLGFSINESKTFHDGPFRESCGLDAFNGVNVTPVYIRNIDSRKATLCHLVNVLGSIAFPNGALANYLLSLTESKKLPLVPVQESTISGVWISPEKARSLGILRRKWGIDKCKSYVPFTRKRIFVDIRGYYLWFLNKNSQVLFGGPWHLARPIYASETSSVPIFEHKYVRKWVVWNSPHHDIADHLYWWSELFNPPLNGAGKK